MSANPMYMNMNGNADTIRHATIPHSNGAVHFGDKHDKSDSSRFPMKIFIEREDLNHEISNGAHEYIEIDERDCSTVTSLGRAVQQTIEELENTGRTQNIPPRCALRKRNYFIQDICAVENASSNGWDNAKLTTYLHDDNIRPCVSLMKMCPGNYALLLKTVDTRSPIGDKIGNSISIDV